MKLNERFFISLTYTLRNQPPVRIEIPADRFFADGARDYSANEWGNDLPWEKLSLEEYLNLSAEHLPNLTMIELDIRDKVAAQTRRITERRWGDHAMRMDWNNVLVADGHFMLSIRESNRNREQIVQGEVTAGKLTISSHNRFALDQLDAIEHCYDI